MKRPGSRFTIDEINKVVENWESVVKSYGGTFKLEKKTIDDRHDYQSKLLDPHNRDQIQHTLYWLEIKIPHKGYYIEINTGETKTPIFKLKSKSKDFNFSISSEDYFEKFLKLFGSDELQVGDPDFDKMYLLRTNNKERLKEFLDKNTREWLKGLTLCYFDLNSPKSEGKLSLYFVFNELDKNEIIKHIEMFKYCTDKL